MLNILLASVKTKPLLPFVLLFLLVITALFYFLGFHTQFFLGPYGMHYMRQTDSLSFASQYYNKGYNFFSPQLYNLKNVDGKAACEFPVIYYLTALLYFVFGKQMFILKLIHLIIVYAGVYCFFRMSFLILKDLSYAMLITLFLFTSTVFNFYSFNYLPDAPALGFTLIGWYLIYNYTFENKKKHILIGFLFFTLASLIKVTYLINPLAALILASYYFFFQKKDLSFIIQAKKIIEHGITGVFIVLIWNAYMFYYNDFYNSTSFNTSALPIWSLSVENIGIIWDYINNYWYSKYFAQSSFHLLFALVLLQLVFLKKINFEIHLFTLIMFLGNLAYFLLFYAQFKDHDYYFLTFFPFILLILITGIKTVQNISKKSMLHVCIKLLFLTLVIIGINYSRSKLSDRYNVNEKISPISYLIQENLLAIKNLNIPDNSKYIVGPDYSQNGGLLLLDKMGWNIESSKDITEFTINSYKSLGAQYLLLASSENDILAVGKATGTVIFEAKGISIFKLNKPIGKK